MPHSEGEGGGRRRFGTTMVIRWMVRVIKSEVGKVKVEAQVKFSCIFAAIMYYNDHHFDNTTVVFQDILSERSKEPR